MHGFMHSKKNHSRQFSIDVIQRGSLATGGGRWYYKKIQATKLKKPGVRKMLPVTEFPKSRGCDMTDSRMHDWFRQPGDEDLSRILLQHCPVMLWMAGLNGTIDFMNRVGMEYFGITPQNIRDNGWRAFLHPEDTGIFEEALRTALDREQLFQSLVRGQQADGSWRWVEWHGMPTFDHNGSCTGLSGSLSDITEHVVAEERMDRERELFQTIFNEIPVMLVLWDPTLRKFSLNRHAEAVLGWTGDDVADGDFMSRVYPDLEYRSRVASFMESLEAGWHEWNVTTRDGSVVPSDWANIRLSDDTMIGIGVDLSEKKDAELELAQYRQRLEEMVVERTRKLREKMDELTETQQNVDLIINTVPDGIVVTTGDGQVIFANPAAKKILGKEHPELFGTRFGFPVTHEPSEITVRLDEQRSSVLELHTTEIRWQDNPCFLTHFRDITRERADSDKVRELSQRVLEAQEMERRDIGHELHDEVGGMLTAIKLELGRVRKKLDEAAVSELERVNALLDETMDGVSNLSQKMRPDILNEYGLAEALRWHFDQYTGRTSVRVQFDTNLPDARFPGTIETAAYRIIQEALTNVARHAGTDEVSVRVYCGEDMIRIEVEDSGCGFDDTQVKIASNGIAGMQDRAYLAGGDLFIDSSPGRGTIVTCSLPTVCA